MICEHCQTFSSDNSKSLSNHTRWCGGSMEHVRNILSESKKGSRNPQWQPTNPSSVAVHLWIRRNYKKPDKCEYCRESKRLDLANVSPTYNPDTYTRDIKNWHWLCRRCHMQEDGRLEIMLGRTLKQKECPYCHVMFKPPWIGTIYCSRVCFGLSKRKVNRAM